MFATAAAVFIASPMITLAKDKNTEQVWTCNNPDMSTDSLAYIEGKVVHFVPMLEQSPVVLTTQPTLLTVCNRGDDLGKTGIKKSL